MDNFGMYNNGSLNIDLTNLSYSGEQVIASIGKAASGTVSSVNGLLPDNAGNVSITSDSIPAGTNKYYSDTLVDTHLLNVLTTDQDILIRNGASVGRFGVGAVNTLLSTDINGKLSWSVKPNVYSKLSQLDDCSIATPSNNQFLVYENLFWKNKSITSDSVTQGTSNLYYNDSLVLSYLKSIMTNTGDMLYRDSNNNIVRLPIGVAGQRLEVALSGVPTWSTTSLTTLNNSVTDVEYNQTLTTNMYMYYDNTVGVKKWRVDNLQLNNGRFGDINMSAYSAGDVLILNGVSGKWENKAPIWINKTEYTASGDLLYGTGNGTYTKLSIGANDKVLQVKSGALSWETLPAGVTSLSALTDVSLGTLADNDYLYYDNSVGVQKWKNKQSTWINKTEYTASGDILYGTGNGTYTKLSIGANDKVLQVKSGVPSWETFSAATTLSALTDVSLGTLADNDYLYYDNSVGVQKWKNKQLVIPKFATLGVTADDIQFGTLNTHQTVFYEGGKWKNGEISLFWLSNTSQANGLNNNDVLTYNSTSTKWENIPFNTTSTNFIKSILTTSQDLLIRNASNDLARFGIGSNGQSIMARAGGLVWDRSGFADIANVTINSLSNKQILRYDGTNWLNSGDLTTAETNITNNSAAIVQLQNNAWSATQTAPIVSPQTISFNQTTFPIIKTTYTAFSGIVPLGDDLLDASGNVQFLNSGPSGTSPLMSAGIYNGVATAQLQRQIFFRLLPADLAVIQANYGNNYLWIDNLTSSQGNLKVCYINNPLQVGTYTYKVINRGAWSPTTHRVYGLRTNNRTMALNFVADRTYTLPTVGTDYTLLYSAIGTHPNAAGTFDHSITTTEIYYAIGFYVEGGGNVGIGLDGLSLMSTTTNTDNLSVSVTPGVSNVSYSNTAGSMILTRNGAIAGETWSISYALLTFWYIHTIVMTVCRNANQINLNNTVKTDTNTFINNASNAYYFKNSVGTSTYLTIDANQSKVLFPVYASMMYYDGGVSSQANITALGTYVQLPLTVTNSYIVSTSFTVANSQMTCNKAGIYKVSFNASINFGDNNELLVRCCRNNLTTFIPGIYSLLNSNNNYMTYSGGPVIVSLAVNDVLFLAATKQQGALPKIANVISATLTCEMLNIS